MKDDDAQAVDIVLQDEIEEPIAEKQDDQNSWENCLPRISDEDIKMANDFFQFLYSKYAKKDFKNFDQIRQLQDEAKTRFAEDLGMIVDVTITPKAVHILGGEPVALVLGKDYRYVDGELWIKGSYRSDVVIWQPTIVIQDYISIDEKKVKAETAIWQRERRRAMGEDYWNRGTSPARKIHI